MHKLLAGMFVLSAVVAVPVTANALGLMLPQASGPNRAALSDAIVVGRVMGMEDVDVKVAPAPGSTQMTTYRIAIVSVTEVVRGKKEMKQIRVGFTPTGVAGPNVGPAAGPAVRPGLNNNVAQLTVGQDGLFFLQKHPTADFLVTANRLDFVSSQDKAIYEKELTDAKHAAKLLDNPMEGLKSRDAKDRYLTAALLITMYRSARVIPNKQEPIGVEESKLILEALAESDGWKAQMAQPKPGGVKGGPIIKGGPVRFDPMGPQQMFNMLGVTQQDGFMPPAKISSPDDYANACREWCQKNAGTYQIKRFVSAK
jgi:hypothetical protein